MYSRKHVRDLVVGFGVVLAFAAGFSITMAAVAEEAKGTGMSEAIALDNSLISAHFTCNKQGLWADPTTLTHVDTVKDSYRLAGGRKKIPYITVSVTFDCTTDFVTTTTEEEVSL